jgi:hypothetical protein
MRPHVVVLHRWRARYAEYERYIDHGEYAVSYVATEVGASSVPPDAAAVTVVDATDDLSAVTVEVKRLAGRFGAPVAIVGLKEDDLLVAARLRREWGCPGPGQAGHGVAGRGGGAGGARLRRRGVRLRRARLRRAARLAGGGEAADREFVRRRGADVRTLRKP